MATFTSGTGATFTTTVLEEYLFALIDSFGQTQELDTVKNPNQLNYLQSSVNRDAMTASLTVSFPCLWGTDNIITIPDYLTGVTFTNGTGGDFEGLNWVTTIVKIIVRMASDEREGSKNPENKDVAQWSLENRTEIGVNNAIFKGTLTDFPLVFLTDASGASIYKGKAYLLGTWD